MTAAGARGTETVEVRVDGEAVELRVTAATSLLRALRDAGHTATTGACEQGECGSCSVLLDGDLVCSCLVPAAVCASAEITTVRSLLRPDLAEAFARHGAVQCGFCTPGFVVAAEAALAEDPTETNYNRLVSVQGQVRREHGLDALIEGFGLSSGRPVKSF